MSLGDLIQALEDVSPSENPDRTRVYFDFGRTYPGRLVSDRGSYAELAITFETGDYADPEPLTVETFIAVLRDALRPGRTFSGWKGGEYQMHVATPLWVAQWGDWGSTAVVGVRDLSHEVVIDTEWTEF